MIPNQAQSTNLRVCQTRAGLSSDSHQELERDFARTMRHQGLHLVKDELQRAADADRAPEGFINRLHQSIDLLLGRNKVWVERRRSTRS